MMSSNIDSSSRGDISETQSSTNQNNISFDTSESSIKPNTVPSSDDERKVIKNKNILLGLLPSTDSSSIGHVLKASEALVKQGDKTVTNPLDDEKDVVKSRNIRIGLSSCTDDSSMEEMLKDLKPLPHQNYKTDTVNKLSLEDKKAVIKTRNIRLGLSSIADASSKKDVVKTYTSSQNDRDDTINPNNISLDDEKDIKNIPLRSRLNRDELSRGDVLKTHESSMNESVSISLDADEKHSDADQVHTTLPPLGGIEKSKNTFYREKSPRFTCPISVNIDEKETYLNMKRFPYASRTYGSSRKESLQISPNIIGGDFHFLRNKNAESEKEDEIEDGRKRVTKLQIEDEDLFPLDNKDAASVISTETNTSVSTLRETFRIPNLKDRPPARIIESGTTRTHWRTTGFYRNCPQTFITKHARLEKKNWTNIGFVVVGLYVFGFFCLGYTVSSSAMVNPIIIISGVLLISLASLILYLIYATEKNRSLYTLSSGERRKVTFSNPFPSAH